jgi:hypothetical protein
MIAGYGSGNYRAQSGRCVQYLAPGPNMPYDIVEVSAAARHGDSGGPILNSRGELAGVLFGEGGGMTSGSAAARVRWFVASLGIQPSADKPTQIAQAATPSQPSKSGVQLMPATSLPSLLASPEHVEGAEDGLGVRGQITGTARTQSSDDLVAVTPITKDFPPVAYPTTDAPPIALAFERQSGGASNESRAAEPLVSAQRPHVTEQLAAKSPPLVSTAPTSVAELHSAQQITLEDLVGHTGGQQLKTALAALGVLFVLYQLTRRIA